MPTGRAKRAAAAAAESRIREFVEDFNRKDEDGVDNTRGPTGAIAAESFVSEVNGYSNRSGGLNNVSGTKGVANATKQASSQSKNKKLKKSDNSRDDPNHFDESQFFPSFQRLSSSIASNRSLQTILDNCSCSSLLSTQQSVLSSSVKAHLAHRRRRACRQVNSTGPMVLSLRSDYRMSLGSDASPQYSPIMATSLSFTPVAQHIPTFSLFQSQDIETKLWE